MEDGGENAVMQLKLRQQEGQPNGKQAAAGRHGGGFKESRKAEVFMKTAQEGDGGKKRVLSG